jgi:hypothetical protein
MDSNAVIDYLGGRFSAAGMAFMHNIVDEVPVVSVITKIELLGFNAPAQHQLLLNSFIEDAQVIGLTDEIVDTCIALRKTHKIKLPDALIAATALVNGLTLISRNTVDFRKIQLLQVVDPHLLEPPAS